MPPPVAPPPVAPPPVAPELDAADRVAPIVRVASVPAGHPYVEQLDLARAGIDVLPDPAPPGAPPGQWWPPVMLEAEWVTAHAAQFDLLHLHFGSEGRSLTELDRLLDALRRAGRPLVYTVHDLEHPQLSDGAHHREQLDRLIPAAAQLITLTPGAAAEIGRRWARTATVIEHPRMLTAEIDPAASSAHAGVVAGVHLRDLRPNIEGPAVVGGLIEAVQRLREEGWPVSGRIVLFDRVRAPADADAVTALCAATDAVTLVRRPRLDDAELAHDLLGIDLSVLPYRHGTHSGWAELCWDLGLPAAGRPLGYIAEQHDEVGWFTLCDPTDAGSLSAVLRRLAAARAQTGPAAAAERRRALIAARRAQRDARATGLREAHRAVYDRALAGRPRADISG